MGRIDEILYKFRNTPIRIDGDRVPAHMILDSTTISPA